MRGDDPEQSKSFIEKTKEIGADDKGISGLRVDAEACAKKPEPRE